MEKEITKTYFNIHELSMLSYRMQVPRCRPWWAAGAAAAVRRDWGLPRARPAPAGSRRFPPAPAAPPPGTVEPLSLGESLGKKGQKAAHDMIANGKYILMLYLRS